MKKIATKLDCDNLSTMPTSVHCVVEEIVAKLNFYYGEHRSVDNDMGGYVLLITVMENGELNITFKAYALINNLFQKHRHLVNSTKEDKIF